MIIVISPQSASNVLESPIVTLPCGENRVMSPGSFPSPLFSPGTQQAWKESLGPVIIFPCSEINVIFPPLATKVLLPVEVILPVVGSELPVAVMLTNPPVPPLYQAPIVLPEPKATPLPVKLTFPPTAVTASDPSIAMLP